MSDHKSKFDRQVDSIIFDESVDDVDAAIDSLDDEDGEQQPEEKPDTTELAIYEERQTRVQKKEDDQSDVVEDYQYTRNTLYGLIERGKTALEGSLMVAKESEHPRAYEVTSALMKNLSDISKQLMDVSETMENRHGGTGSSGKGGQPQTVNNVQNNNYYGDQSVDDVLDDLDDDEEQDE